MCYNCVSFGDLYVYILEWSSIYVLCRRKQVTQAISIMTFFLTQLWKPYIRMMEKLWGFSFQSNQTNSPVRATDSIIRHQRAVITEILQRSGRVYRLWQCISSLASILSFASAQTHWITQRSTQKQQVGSLGLFGLDEIALDDSFPSPICTILICFLSFLCVPGAENAHNKESQSHNGCECAGERGLQAGKWRRTAITQLELGS